MVRPVNGYRRLKQGMTDNPSTPGSVSSFFIPLNNHPCEKFSCFQSTLRMPNFPRFYMSWASLCFTIGYLRTRLRFIGEMVGVPSANTRLANMRRVLGRPDGKVETGAPGSPNAGRSAPGKCKCSVQQRCASQCMIATEGRGARRQP